jgi:hypothetical protein
MMNPVYTIYPGAGINQGYFDDDNITFIQTKIAQVLLQEYIQHIHVTRADIIRVMLRVLEERRENVPKMNQRVIMYICDDFRNHQTEVNKHQNWEKYFVQSQRLMDMDGNVSRFDQRSIKTNDQKKYNGQTKVGGTLRFHFT